MTFETIELTLLANATGGRAALGQQPYPAEWNAQPAPAGYQSGVPSGCWSSVSPSGKLDARRQWAIPPGNCFGDPNAPDNNQGYGQ